MADCYPRVRRPCGDFGLAFVRVVQPPQRRRDTLDQGASILCRLYVVVYRCEARRATHRYSSVGLVLRLRLASRRGRGTTWQYCL